VPEKQGFFVLLLAGFLFRLLFGAEEGGEKFLRNVLLAFTRLHGDIPAYRTGEV
jgi:hypothetical protein